jgi:hypothetical protein
VPLEDALRALADARPVFHSEADFQHHLAWTVRRLDPDVQIRLETRPLPGERLHLDLLLVHPVTGDRVAVELKYATRALTADIGGESFQVRDQAAQDLVRHDFVKDVHRIERLIAAGVVNRGWCLFITNDQGYWNPSSRATIDSAFRLHHGRVLAGALSWSSTAGAGTTVGRDTVLELTGRYQLAWTDFSAVAEAPGGSFRSLAVFVGQSQPMIEDPLPTDVASIPNQNQDAAIKSPPLPARTENNVRRLQAMVDELRAMRADCEPKSNLNPRYLRYSNAVSALTWIADDLRREEIGE